MKPLHQALSVLALLSVAAVASADVTLSSGRFYDPVAEKIVSGRGVVYMQPNAMHHHFWQNLKVDRLDADFEFFKERGFDTIVLKPCWGDFIPEVWYFDGDTPQPQLDEDMFDLLELVVDTAADYDLYVLIMTGVMTAPDLYTDAGQTLSTRIWTANYWVRFNVDPYNPALYEDPNTFHQWCVFQYYLAGALADKDNVLGYVIEPETTQAYRDLTATECYWWDYWVNQGDANALTGYTPIVKNSTTCNMANTDLIFLGSYPSSAAQAANADNVSADIADVRTYNQSLPICIRETGVATAGTSYVGDQTESHQSTYVRAVRDICEEGGERLAGYCFWMSQDFDPEIFGDGNITEWETFQSAFGLWDINGLAKLAGDNWIDIKVDNPSFETLGSASRPDGWETAWPYKGTPSGWSVQRAPYSPYDGSYHLRMYTGTGAPDSIIFCASDTVQATPNTPMTVRAWMRYALSTGDAYLAVIELDEDSSLTQWEEESFTGSNWTWKQNEISFVTHPDTAYLYVRFGIGGQSAEYLDVDLESDLLTHQAPNGSFEVDDDSDDEPDNWETIWVWNGSRTGWAAERVTLEDEVINGLNCFRLYTGASGDSGARVMVDSDKFHAQPSTTYDVKAYMRYAAAPSGTVDWWVLEYDASNSYLGIGAVASYSGDQTDWVEKTLSFTTRSTTAKFVVRLTAGSQSGAVTFDVDWLRDYTP